MFAQFLKANVRPLHVFYCGSFCGGAYLINYSAWQVTNKILLETIHRIGKVLQSDTGYPLKKPTTLQLKGKKLAAYHQQSQAKVWLRQTRIAGYCRAKGTVQSMLPAESYPIPLTSYSGLLVSICFNTLHWSFLCQRWRGPSQTEHKPKPSSLLCPSGLPTALWQKSLLPGHWFSDVMDFCEPGRTYEHISPPQKKLETVLVQWEKSRSGSSISQFFWSSILCTPGPLRLHPSPQLPSQALEGLSAANAAVKDKTMDDKLYDVIVYIHTNITLHYITLHYIALHCIALHCITLHYYTLH